MKSVENFVRPDSDYYIHTPEPEGMDLYLYVLQCGHFYYEPGYHLKRSSYNSYLLGYIFSGSLDIALSDFRGTARAGEAFLIDCGPLHAYETRENCDCLWFHFDGVTARGYYDRIVRHHRNVIRPSDPDGFEDSMMNIYETFREGRQIVPARLSLEITILLTDLLTAPSEGSAFTKSYSLVLSARKFIGSNYAKPITMQDMASSVSLSPYYFSRIFKEQTGESPYQYLLKTRIHSAKYLLKNSSLSVKEVCYASGFSCESVFCTAFRQKEGMTPSEYRYH